jgi:4-hydroxy-4-methyl-2-oxoglutarate aldolase
MDISNNELKQFLELPTGNICDANGKSGNMDAAIKPIDPRLKMVGPAYTVRCHPGDNLAIHRGIYEAPAGAVLVVDARGYCQGGHFGEIMALACQKKGIAGLVIDGTCRDGEEIKEMGFPVFCRGLNPGGTVKETIGVTNGVIQCGGLTINPGDIIIGDSDGVVAVKKEMASVVLKKAQAIAEKEKEVKMLLCQGKTTVEIFGFDKVLNKDK